MKKSGAARCFGLLILLCWLVYTSAYLGRLNYTASMVRIISELGVSKTTGGIVSSCFFFAYGAGQLINGLLSKYYNLRLMIPLSLLASALINLAVPLCGSINWIQVLWLLNGLVQSVLWSTLIRTLGLYLPADVLPRAILAMSTTTATGTAVTYGLSALFIRFFTWRVSFCFATVLLAAVAVFWFIGFGRVSAALPALEKKQEERQQTSGKKTPAFLLVFGFILLFAILNNFIKDSLTAWTPSILYELYNLPQTLSILLTLGLPLLAIFGASASIRLNRRIRSHVPLCGVFYGISFVAVMVLVLLLPLRSWPLTLVCFALASLSMAAVNNVITNLMPLQLREQVDCGRTAGTANAFCYIGSTLSTVVMGAVADRFGWNGVFYLLLALAGAALILCGIYFPLNRRIMLDKQKTSC